MKIFKKKSATPRRFRDYPLNRDYVKRLRSDNLPLTEAKSENRINRIAGTAARAKPSACPPVPNSFKLTVKQFDGDEETLLDTLLQGLKLLEWDSLGGNGSRGYGKVAFTAITRNGEHQLMLCRHPTFCEITLCKHTD